MTKRRTLWIPLLLAAALLPSPGCTRGGDGETGVRDAAGGSSSPGRASVSYVCPMHPQMTSDRPGDCSVCGMKLVPPSGGAGEASASLPTTPAGLAPVSLSAETRRRIGMTLGTVERRASARELRAPARIAIDPSRVHRLSSAVEGWVEKAWIQGAGEKVRKGGPLLSFYVSDWRDLAVVSREVPLSQLQERLKRWGLAEAEVERVSKAPATNRVVTLTSPSDGFVLERSFAEGQRMVPGDPLVAIADLSQVWAEVDLFESDIPNVKPGMATTLTFPSWPGKEFRGRITVVSPFLDRETRTLRARVEVPNGALQLRPEMLGVAHVAVDLGPRLIAPEGSVIRTGERAYAFRAADGDRIVPVEVTLGARIQGSWEIVAGLSEGDRVVTSASFLLDSESALAAALKTVASGVTP